MKRPLLIFVLLISLFSTHQIYAQIFDARQVTLGSPNNDSIAMRRYTNDLYRNNGSGWTYLNPYALQTFIPIYFVSGLDLLDSIVASYNFIKRTSISATAPLSYNNSTGVFSIQQASGSQSGYLSSANWNAFNNKFDAPIGIPSQYIRGDGSIAPFPAAVSTNLGSSKSGNFVTITSSTGAGTPFSVADGDSSATNEIELPTQTGNSGKGLTTNGSSPSWVTMYAPNYTAYEALVTQSGTSAPTAARKDANFSGVTFTWARSALGAYTLTANSPVFTSGKTAVVTSLETGGLQKFTATITSTTVITFSTTVQSIISLVLSLVGTDGLFTNTLVEVRIYA